MADFNYNFSGKVALVTGASSGIGRATALAFAQEGAWVAVSDINEDGGLGTVKMIQEAGGESLFLKCDVSSPASISNLMEAVHKKMGSLNYAFNNAGIEGEQAMIAESTEDNWNKVIDTNLKGVWFCMKQQIALMLQGGGGAIVNCSSVAGLIGFPGIAAYSASKHGIIGLTKTAALEYSKQNIRVNAVCPGAIQTHMLERYTHGDAAAYEQLRSAEPVGRVGKPDEIAAGVLWLCSDQASFVTGHSLVIDGGWVAQ